MYKTLSPLLKHEDGLILLLLALGKSQELIKNKHFIVCGGGGQTREY
jgi:hypothetical protein